MLVIDLHLPHLQIKPQPHFLPLKMAMTPTLTVAAKAVVEIVANTEEVIDLLKLKGHIKIAMLVVSLLIVDHHIQQVKSVIESGS